MPSFQYNPDRDIADQTGKVFLVTGGTAGIGKETILQLSKHNPAHIYFTGRNRVAADTLIAECSAHYPSTNLTFIPCDQTSLSSVSTAAKEFLAKSQNRLDVLICNAGIMATPPAVSQDGYEIQFAVNHLAHALLIRSCLPALSRTAEEKGDARIVSLTSLSFKTAPSQGIIFKDLKSDMAHLGFTAKFLLYAQSKLANVLYASQLSKRFPNITSVSIHPGLIPSGTDLGQHLGWFEWILTKLLMLWLTPITLSQGAFNSLWAATSFKSVGKAKGKGQEQVEKGVVSGGVYEPVGAPVPHTKHSANEEMGRELWEWTERELKAYL